MGQHSLRGSGRALIATLAISALLSSSAAVAGTVATPALSAAPPGTHGFPAESTVIDLSTFGYLEQEFLMQGTAQAFLGANVFGSQGQWNAVPNAGAVAPYTTRLLVRRPTNPARFNGTVYIEWLNVSGGSDSAPEWNLSHDELLREGYAYVGVTAQWVGAVALQGWESGLQDRYASITHPGDSFSYDIYSQAAVAVRSPAAAGPEPLGNLTGKIRAVLAAGDSQSGARLFTYVNSIHPLAQVFDGFIVHGAAGGTPLSQPTPGGFDPSLPPLPGVPFTPWVVTPTGAAAVVRTDSKTPVLFVNTETDTIGAVYGVHKQPDSSKFRLWELAGVAHANQFELDIAVADAAKSGIVANFNCGELPIASGPHNYAMRAAVHALHAWVRYGVPAPKASRIQMNIPDGSPATVVRDPSTGNALGGLRLPQIAVPLATYTGERPPTSLTANPFCFLFGATDAWNGDADAYDGQPGFDPSPTPEPVLRNLYPDRNAYLSSYLNATLGALLHGYLRPRDAMEVWLEAVYADVP